MTRILPAHLLAQLIRFNGSGASFGAAYHTQVDANISNSQLNSTYNHPKLTGPNSGTTIQPAGDVFADVNSPLVHIDVDDLVLTHIGSYH